MLSKIFEDLKKLKLSYCTSTEGKEFEDKFQNLLRNNKFTLIEKEQLNQFYPNNFNKNWKVIKDSIRSKNSVEIIKNNFFVDFNNSYMFQPNGSQEFPDFLIFTKNYILPIEIKFIKREISLKSARPKWNSNLPKSNCIYLFGVKGKTLTYFLGSDILESRAALLLNNFFGNLNTDFEQEKLKTNLKDLNNDFGFYPSIRKDFLYKEEFSSYLNEKNQKKIDSFFSNKMEERENNVINFLKNL